MFALTDDSPPPRPRGGARVRIGIQPDYAGAGGILLNGVAEDGPAQKAGLRAGDLIVSWNGTELGSIEDLMPLLIEAKPGDVVSVGVKRDEGIVILEVTLEAAGGGGEPPFAHRDVAQLGGGGGEVPVEDARLSVRERCES